MIIEAVGFDGKIVFDKSKPNGAMRKLLDNSRITALGWTAKTDEQTGLRKAYEDYLGIAALATSSARY